jgi:hypothetical protein
MYTCRECDAAINSGSEVCPYCGADLTSPAADVFGEPAPVAKKPSAKRILIACGILLLTLALVGWFAVPWRLSGSKKDSEMRARDAMATIQASLTSYESAERAFPSSLEALGDTARSAARTAQLGHYTLQYTPGKPDAEGRITSYALTARPGNFGFQSFYTDESGVLHATTEDRVATVQDPVVVAAPKP